MRSKIIATVALVPLWVAATTPDNQRLYISNSLLSNLDGNVPYRVRLINVTATGMALDPKFDVDFQNFPTGAARPHDMLLK
ncbi:MAG TPA: hypothetical protein VLV45_04780 [Gemmatimonadales bacterium]|nr:hypothetical protein [Gemmatimonadales bacterium]